MRRAALFVLLGLAAVAVAQTAAGPAADPVTRYHDGARLYIDGDLDAAAQAVDAGLATAPDDARLQALRDLIRQQQQGGGGGDEGEDAQDPPPPDGPDRDGAPPDTPPADDGQGAPHPSGSAPGQGAPAGADARPVGMSRAEAEALLDAVGGDERLLLRDLRRRPASSVQPDRDW